jgi:molybdate-binding protein
VCGYDNEVLDHYDGAQMVVNRMADAALGFRAVAEAFDLDFVPMETVRCDLVIPRDLMEHPPMKIILDALQSRWLREELSMLPGYEASVTGKVIAHI